MYSFKHYPVSEVDCFMHSYIKLTVVYFLDIHLEFVDFNVDLLRHWNTDYCQHLKHKRLHMNTYGYLNIFTRNLKYLIDRINRLSLLNLFNDIKSVQCQHIYLVHLLNFTL